MVQKNKKSRDRLSWRLYMRKQKPKKKNVKTIITTDGMRGFFKRGKAIAKLADQGKPIPHVRIINFDNPEDMLAILTKARRHLMMVIREGASSIPKIVQLTHRDRAAIVKDIKLLEKYGLITISKETNPGHGLRKIIRPVSNRPIQLKTII